MSLVLRGYGLVSNGLKFEQVGNAVNPNTLELLSEIVNLFKFESIFRCSFGSTNSSFISVT